MPSQERSEMEPVLQRRRRFPLEQALPSPAHLVCLLHLVLEAAKAVKRGRPMGLMQDRRQAQGRTLRASRRRPSAATLRRNPRAGSRSHSRFEWDEGECKELTREASGCLFPIAPLLKPSRNTAQPRSTRAPLLHQCTDHLRWRAKYPCLPGAPNGLEAMVADWLVRQSRC